MDMMIAEQVTTYVDVPVRHARPAEAPIGWSAFGRNKLEGYVRNNVRQNLDVVSKPFDLTDCVGRAIKLAKAAMGQRGSELHSDLLAPLVTVGDARLLARAMASLIAMVSAHAARDSEVSCKLTLRGGAAVIGVSIISDVSGREQIATTLGGTGTQAFRPPATAPGLPIKPWLARLILEEHRGRVRLLTSSGSRTMLEIELPGSLL